MIVASHLVFLTVKWAYNRLTERFTGKLSHILKLFMIILMFSTPFPFLFSHNPKMKLFRPCTTKHAAPTSLSPSPTSACSEIYHKSS